ncbi:metal-response element-binding transcription factor 2-like isoform X2 [Corticium candelabrum]|uniref:metal-response element-binding transcription factor 2-like isoform X2 n=1 Tax=Corticium candelabrum TaxID=121492 RepID=UPI002E259DBD|nr:metal-response element-binding transcription factor 2-like isoform X2 [Corticium candelabrum]
MVDSLAGKEVVVRWADGLQYYGRITSIEQKAQKFCVEFAPGILYLVQYKDVKGVPGAEEEEGYHQRCHKPRIESKVLLPHIDWICLMCTHSDSNGGKQRAKLAVRSLPYSLSSLSWNESHTSNSQDTYCYCGGPGEWYNKMVQCAGCKQWFHQACLTCLGEPSPLYGDRFYYFLCSVCNAGAEYIQRLQLSFNSAIQLVLFHLVLVHQRKYIDFEQELMPFFEQHKAYLGCNKSVEVLKSEMWETLEVDRSRFASAKEVKKKKGLWSLRGGCIPPLPVSFPSRPPKGAKTTLYIKKGVTLPLSLQPPIKGVPPTVGYGIKHSMIRSGLSKPRTPSPLKRPQQLSHLASSAKKTKLARCLYPADGAPPFHDFHQLKLYVQRMRGETTGSTKTSTGAAALISSGARYEVLARRVTTDKQEEYLIQWL